MEQGDHHIQPIPLSDARSVSGRGLIQLGLLLPIATPVARVMFSVVGFIRPLRPLVRLGREAHGSGARQARPAGTGLLNR